MEFKRTDKFVLITGLLLFFIPAILYFCVGEVQKSISSYVYTCPLVFSSLLSIGAWAYFNKGFVSYKSRFDIIIGLSLFGVIFTPCNDYFIIHYIFATIFFLGNTFNIMYFCKKEHRKYMILLGLTILLGMTGHFILHAYNLYWAEWIGLLPMTVNYILEGLNLTE
jgi:formate hydrogenlyase subunit 3/multisubunit Na+/H+ antiporter MnhD subunit